MTSEQDTGAVQQTYMVQYSQRAPDRGHYTKGNKAGFYINTYADLPTLYQCRDTKDMNVQSSVRSG